MSEDLEFWMKGPVPGVPALLQPVTLIRLLFHSAEHGMRHLGQMKVTAKVMS